MNSSKRHDKLVDHEQTAIGKETVSRQFSVGEKVMFWDTHHHQWKEGVIKELQGSKVFLIAGEDGATRKHLDQITKGDAVVSADNSGKESQLATGWDS